MNKKCNKCEVTKNVKLFRERIGTKTNKDGRRPLCNVCELTEQKEMRRSFLGKLKAIYHNQVINSKKRGHEPPIYSLNEFVGTYINDKSYEKLHKEWVESGYDRLLAPSFDREDDYKGYSFENFNKWMTFDENNRKYHSDSVSGKNTMQCKKVEMTNILTGEVTEFHSAAETGRSIDSQPSAVNRCCRGERNKHKGYTFRYV